MCQVLTKKVKKSHCWPVEIILKKCALEVVIPGKMSFMKIYEKSCVINIIAKLIKEPCSYAQMV